MIILRKFKFNFIRNRGKLLLKNSFRNLINSSNFWEVIYVQSLILSNEAETELYKIHV